jgi:anaerobic selenocysteine-containing dehydrogenase
MGLLNNCTMDRRFFHRFGASRLDRTICSTAGGVGLTDTLGFRYGTEPEQYPQSRLIIAWGANILGTSVHYWPFITEARRNGARFYTIDPYKNRTGRLADRHYFIHPGSDLALAFGLLHVIFAQKLQDADYLANYTTGVETLQQRAGAYAPERVEALTGIPREDIVALAREYASTKPAVIRLGYGVQRSDRGAAAVRVIAMLPAVIGSWRHPGGGLTMSTSQAHQLNRAALERADLQKVSALGREARLINMSTLGSALTELDNPPVKALIVYNSNPGAIAPDQNRIRQGLRREDLFTVVLEQFQTDTADFADILLPATTFLEHTDLYYAYGHYHLQMARPAIAPPGECKSNLEVFRLLARRMGFDDPCFEETEDSLIAAALDSGHPFLKGITVDRLDREHSVRLNVAAPDEPFLPFAKGGFGTAAGKCDLDVSALDYTPPVESRRGSDALAGRYPLELISPKHDDSMNSTFGNRSDQDRQTSLLYMHSEDAAPRGIRSGDPVRVWNDRGSLILEASVNGAVPRGVVGSPSSRWPKMSPDRANVNVLTSERLTDAGGGPTLYSCLVEVTRCGD